ncbi:putative peptidyl-tRNA hydrolase PTRHD1 isoform X2 [Chelonus insularis]|uniref:putative peptidyl-tRNA hydrolase PTRHD1 isoform X2 n=1 Tax=Chelonus insularis TaxID=460826 RepID=UPI00158E2F99|nr:putative peptidyl-tRNA hydrolase PTRHD1 isoform X2 [Chelonus insularis]
MFHAFIFKRNIHEELFLQVTIFSRNRAVKMSGIVQYVVVRGDLMKSMGWPVGAVIAQACHACTAVTHLFYDDQYTKAYLEDLDNMHKVVLEAPDEKSLNDLHTKLAEEKVHHKLWIEQPENIPTCLVAKPYPKDVVQKYFKKFKLFKN